MRLQAPAIQTKLHMMLISLDCMSNNSQKERSLSNLWPKRNQTDNSVYPTLSSNQKDSWIVLNKKVTHKNLKMKPNKRSTKRRSWHWITTTRRRATTSHKSTLRPIKRNRRRIQNSLLGFLIPLRHCFLIWQLLVNLKIRTPPQNSVQWTPQWTLTQ